MPLPGRLPNGVKFGQSKPFLSGADWQLTAILRFLALLVVFHLIACSCADAAKLSEAAVRNTLIRAKNAGINMTPQEAESLSNEAEDIYCDGRMQSARQIMSIVCASKSVTCKYLCQLADYCTDVLGEIDEQKLAHKYLNQALKLDPNCSEAWEGLARLAMKEGEIEKALGYADHSIKMPSGRKVYPKSYLTRATILAHLKRHDAALADLAKAKKEQPDTAEVYRVEGSILENLKRYAAAAESYRIALKIHKIDWAQYRLVSCLERQRLYKEALAELNSIVKTNPSDAEAYRARSDIREKMNDLTGAIADLSKVVELEPTTKAYLQRAKLYKRVGKGDLARKDELMAERLDASPF